MIRICFNKTMKAPKIIKKEKGGLSWHSNVMSVWYWLVGSHKAVMTTRWKPWNSPQSKDFRKSVM